MFFPIVLHISLGEEDADYSIKIMNMIKLYGKPIRVNKASSHQKNLDVGANLFIGNLDPEVDEKPLYDTFSAFGVILQTPKIMRDPETGNSKVPILLICIMQRHTFWNAIISHGLIYLNCRQVDSYKL